MGLVNGRGRFSTLHSSETPRPIFMKLELYNYLPDMTLHAKFQGAVSTWIIWANSQFDAWKFLSFFISESRQQVTFWTHPHTQYVIIRHSCQGRAFWELLHYQQWTRLITAITTEINVSANWRNIYNVCWNWQGVRVRSRTWDVLLLSIPSHQTPHHIKPAAEIQYPRW